ncbi:MAG: hypothetical protein U5R49_11565 [Deltaproteobacteria bacterium]|nr:hypothetical protein [Deltaproteobacteria bacterium]
MKNGVFCFVVCDRLRNEQAIRELNEPNKEARKLEKISNNNILELTGEK